MRSRTALAALLLAAPTTLRSQAVIDPGMSKAQVVAKLGPPTVQRNSGASTYLFYRNGAERAVGMSDIVVLDGDKVVDAVFRSSARKYGGKSSSPAAIPAAVARKKPPVTPPPAVQAASPAASGVAPAAGAARTGATESRKMPAEKAQEAQIAKPTPQARSAMLEQQKTDSARSSKAADSAKAAKTDAKAPPPKKP